MSRTKTALIFADRKGAQIAPLNDHFSPANMPIAGKSALEFWFEYLCEQKIEQVYLFTAAHTPEIKAQFPSGEHWGFELHYLSSRGEESPSELVARNSTTLPTQFLALRGDVVPYPTASGNLAHTALIDLSTSNSKTELETLSWQSINTGEQPQLLQSMQAIAQVNQLVLESKLWCCTPRGLMLDDHKWTATPDFSQQRIDSTEGSLYVGRDTVIDRTVSLQSNVCVESGSFIDRGATLNNAVVFPGTYVGQNVTLDNCLAYGSLMIDLKHGVAQQIDDPALLSPIANSARVTRTANVERFVAALLMLLTAWIVLPLALLFKSRGKPFTTMTTSRSNRGSRQYPIGFECLSFNTRWSSINSWPKLIHVIDGDLKLFGTALEQLDAEPALPDLPVSQGAFTPQSVHPRHPFDEIEAQLWGFELANSERGFLSLLSQTLRAFANSLFVKPATVQ